MYIATACVLHSTVHYIVSQKPDPLLQFQITPSRQQIQAIINNFSYQKYSLDLYLIFLTYI